MNERPSILIVDSNAGFATMLKESLEQDDDYHATVAHAGDEALASASQELFELAIVDLGIEVINDLDGEAVARQLREEQPHLRLMLIPLVGETLPEDLEDLDVQGVLPKPFFLPDLPDLLEEALTKPLRTVEESEKAAEPTEEAVRPAAVTRPAGPPRESSAHVMHELQNLAREINADAVLLTREDDVLESAGRLAADDVSVLAGIIAQNRQLSSEAARVLGREQRRFEQNVESDEHMLYSVTVAADILLSAILHPDVTLGLLRHEMKATARRLHDLVAEF